MQKYNNNPLLQNFVTTTFILVHNFLAAYLQSEVKLNLDEFRFAPVGMPSASQLSGVKKKKRKA